MAVLRLDLIDPLLSGNKWFKLSGHLAAAREAGAIGLISVGGAHSNHLHAMAAAGNRFGMASAGLLRGNAQSTPTVQDLRRFGMHLHWLGYAGYRARYRTDFWDCWRARYPGYYCVPEGGGGLVGALGCAPLVEQVQALLPGIGWSDYDAWWLAAGTGSTLTGLVIGEAGRHQVLGALAGPGQHAIGRQIELLLNEAGMAAERGYQIFDACRGGFGRIDDELGRFLLEAEQAAGLPLEPIYTAKALLALQQQVLAGCFPAGTRLLFVHTGGLQGRRAALTQMQRL